MMDLIYIAILLLCLILRLCPRILWKEFNGTDSYFHLYYVNLIKKNNNILPKKDPRILGGNNDCTYPYFYHWCLSFFSESFIKFWDKFSGSIFDILTGLILIGILNQLDFIDFRESCLLLSAYIISPGLTFSFIGPRPFSLTPRNFSQFIFALALLFLVISLSTAFSNIFANLILFTLASFLFAVLFLTSQFGTQILISLLLASIFNVYIGLCIILGFIFGVIFSRGFLITQIRAHIDHLEWYYNYNYSFVQHKSNFIRLVSLIKNKDVRGVFYEIVFFNQFLSSLIKHATYFIAISLGVFNFTSSKLTNYQDLVLSILLSLLIPFIVTNFGKMRVFGEAERYIEFAFPLQMFLFITLLPNNYLDGFLYVLLCYNLLFYFYNIYQISQQHSSNYRYENISNQLKSNSTLLCLSNNESYIFLKESKANIIGFLVNISLKNNFNTFFKRFFVQYPMVNPSELSNFCNEYLITHILKNKRHASKDNYKEELSKLNQYSISYEDERYVLYEYKKES